MSCLRIVPLLVLSFLLIVPLYAQEEATAESEVSIAYGIHATGTLNNAKSREVYAFDGQRGEVISISLIVTSGNLDPVLMVHDNSGVVIASADDAEGTRNPSLDALRIPRSDRYFIVVGRFGYDLGSTSGDYELAIDRIGVSSEPGSTLRYGDSVINAISSMTPEVYYSFRAEEGDIINISMERVSGDLDPYLLVVNSNAFVIAENDDLFGSNSLDAAITGLLVEETGRYIIIASRYGQAAGTTTGSFVLSMEEAEHSGLGNSPQAAVALGLGERVEGILDDNEFAHYYTFEARRNDLVTLRMNRAGGSLDSYLMLTDNNLVVLTSNDDSNSSQNSEIGEFLAPYDGTYYIIATRFDREQGTTSGRYQLELQYLGNAFDGVQSGVQRIAYGTTITGRIDDLTPQLLFAFWGVEGDRVTVSMNRGDGDLDPIVSILNDQQRPLVSDDDGGGNQNARIERYTIPVTGVYYIRATRFTDPNSTVHSAGSFILVLARRMD